MLSKKKNKKHNNKIKHRVSTHLETVTSQEIHKLAFQIFGSSYYIDYKVLTEL
jgi:hypothetical protein